MIALYSYAVINIYAITWITPTKKAQTLLFLIA